MAASNRAVVERTDGALHITRTVDAPRALVFQVWTQPEHVSRWWGPHGFTVISSTIDLREGGGYRIEMRSREGTLYTMRGSYREIVPPERLVFTFAWSEPEDMTGFDTVVTVNFTERGGKTTFSFHQTGFGSAEQRDAHIGGWTECFERLDAYTAGL
jgi:uncharacterized protein YndB with AHSA1/START domain